ncbi:MAG: ABC transporter substrate-binding protein [Candidatus Scalinduaceae bacterium]
MINKTCICSVFIFIFLILFQGIYCAYGEKAAVVIKSQDISAYNEAIDGFKSECIKNNISIKYIYDMKGKMKIGYKILREIKKDEPDIILTIGILATTIVKEEIKDIPIIFCMVINQGRFKLAGLNITGITTEIAIEKQLEGYKDLLNSLQDIGVIYDPSKTGNIVESAELKMKGLGVNLVKYKIKSSKMVSKALDSLIGKVDAIWILPDSTVVTKKSFDLIKYTTLKNNTPLLCTTDAFVKAGALAAVFSDYKSIGKQAAQLAKKLLTVSPAGSLGIVFPDEFKLSINSNTAKKLGLELKPVRGKPHVIVYP